MNYISLVTKKQLFFIFLKKYVDFKKTICYIVLDT
nr:MAG TPA: hypothetical protein [Caudoviricetes sp.]